MEITTQHLKRCEVVVIKGRLDASNAKQLGEAFGESLSLGQYNIVVNLKEVSYISSAGLGELIDIQKRCTKPLHRGQVVLAETPTRIKEILTLAGLNDLFKQFPTETEAVGSF